MEENKKRPLSEEELEQVAGGMAEVIYIAPPVYKCKFCGEEFATAAERDKHQANCTAKDNSHGKVFG